MNQKQYIKKGEYGTCYSNVIKKKRQELAEYDREQRRALLAEHGIQMMLKVDDLEDECLQTTGHEWHRQPVCMTIQLSQPPGGPSSYLRCRWCHAVDFPKNEDGTPYIDSAGKIGDCNTNPQERFEVFGP